jgi:hypothetical protein
MKIAMHACHSYRHVFVGIAKEIWLLLYLEYVRLGTF